MSKKFILSISIKGELEGINALDFCKSHNIEPTNNFFIQGSNELIFDYEEVKKDEILKEIFKDKNNESIIVDLFNSNINFLDECVEYKVDKKYTDSYKLGYIIKDKYKLWGKVKELIYDIRYITLGYIGNNCGNNYDYIKNSAVYFRNSKLKYILPKGFQKEIVSKKGRELLGVINKGGWGISEKTLFIQNFSKEVIVWDKDDFNVLNYRRLLYLINSEDDNKENLEIINNIIKKIKNENKDIKNKEELCSLHDHVKMYIERLCNK